jgi:hypothetical protein
MLLPPITQVAEALTRTTEVLAQELVCPRPAAPSWSEFDWRVARASAAMQGISALLCNHLRWQGPPGWQRFLNEQRAQTAARHQKITTILADIDARARRQGVGFVGLKGCALYAMGFYPDAARPMGDIDILVREEERPALTRILEACQYRLAFDSYRHQVFKPQDIAALVPDFGEHIDSPIKIEVHTSVAEHLPVRTADITSLLYPAPLLGVINPYRSSAALLMHLLLHAAGNMRARALRFIQLHDIALLARSLSADDRDELIETRLGARRLWWAAAPLLMTARYFPGSIPVPLIGELEIDSPAALRRAARRQQLADVSWSNVRIEAFPGIEWARGLSERYRFMQSRIWPSREARRELAQGAEQIPSGGQVPWYGVPHAKRIARWIFSNPPRVQTILSVQAALAQDS